MTNYELITSIRKIISNNDIPYCDIIKWVEEKANNVCNECGSKIRRTMDVCSKDKCKNSSVYE